MRVAVAAYLLLIEIARSHDGVSRPEARLIKRYRDALGVDEKHLLEETRTPVVDRLVEGTPKEREEAILAMARVACADGIFSKLERARIHEVAERLEVGRVQAANIFEQVEHEMSSRRTRIVQVVVGIAALALIVGFLISRDKIDYIDAEELESIADKIDPAVLLIHTRFVLERGENVRRTFVADGTGFFVSSDGRIVTNKHVLEPWRYFARYAKLFNEGYTLDPDSVRWAAWQTGVQVFRGEDVRCFENAYDSERSTLKELCRGDDKPRWMIRKTSSGESVAGNYLMLDNHDLVLLKAEVEGPVVAIPLAGRGEAPPSRFTPVFVLGYPHGSNMLEENRAVTASSQGFVRRVENSILVSCSVYPGNSGGPLLDRRGRAIGVAARTYGTEAGLGKCIQMKYLHTLLDRVR